jgi:hypothetical protein
VSNFLAVIALYWAWERFECWCPARFASYMEELAL